MSEASNTAIRHGRTVDVPLEALLAPDPELQLVWAPLAETGVAMECGACENVCTCEDENTDFDWEPPEGCRG